MDHAAQPFGVAPYHLIVEGTALIDTKDHAAVALHPGDMLVFPRGATHRLYMPGPVGARSVRELPTEQVLHVKTNKGSGLITDILCGQFWFETPISNALLDALPEVVLVRTSTGIAQAGLQALVTMLRDETTTAREGATAVVSHLASALFALLMRAWLEQAHTVPGLLALLAAPRLRSALHAMLTEPERPWSVERLARTCHMSRATFARLFRSTGAATPGDVLLRLRMAQAALWLEQSERALGDIAEAVGYRSEAAFCRAFKRSVGMSPGEYRERKNVE
jgi:AraC family transcriptional activator of mtrCDE